MSNSNNNLTAIVSYLTIIGWIIAIIMHSNEKTELGAYHIRQSLGLFILGFILAIIPVLGWILLIVVFIFIIMGLISAVNGEQKPVPLVGEFIQNILKGIG